MRRHRKITHGGRWQAPKKPNAFRPPKPVDLGHPTLRMNRVRARTEAVVLALYEAGKGLR